MTEEVVVMEDLKISVEEFKYAIDNEIILKNLTG